MTLIRETTNARMRAADQADARMLVLPVSQSISSCEMSPQILRPHGSFCRVLKLTLEGVEGSNQVRRVNRLAPKILL